MDNLYSVVNETNPEKVDRLSLELADAIARLADEPIMNSVSSLRIHALRFDLFADVKQILSIYGECISDYSGGK